MYALMLLKYLFLMCKCNDNPSLNVRLSYSYENFLWYAYSSMQSLYHSVGMFVKWLV